MALPRPEPGNGKWWVVGVLGIGAMVAVIVWLGIANTRDAVVPTVTAYQVRSDREVVLDFDVHRPEDRAVSCTLEALDKGFAVVGSLTVTVPATSEKDIHQQATIKTTSRAVTGLVRRCSLTNSGK